MVVDDQTVYDAIYKATDAPNHGMREPWRLVHISKDKLGDFSRISQDLLFQIVRISERITFMQ